MLLSSSYLASSQETRREHQAELDAIWESVPESEHVFLLQKDKLPSWAECEVLPECSREEKLEQDQRLFMKNYGGMPEQLQATASSSKVNVPPMTDLQMEGLRRWEVLMSTGGEVRSGRVPVKEEEPSDGEPIPENDEEPDIPSELMGGPDDDCTGRRLPGDLNKTFKFLERFESRP